jgi:hypothetical protein
MYTDLFQEDRYETIAHLLVPDIFVSTIKEYDRKKEEEEFKRKQPRNNDHIRFISVDNSFLRKY